MTHDILLALVLGFLAAVTLKHPAQALAWTIILAVALWQIL